jgi:hypothetical protein
MLHSGVETKDIFLPQCVFPLVRLARCSICGYIFILVLAVYRDTNIVKIL